MKNRQTLTLSPEISARARTAARRKGMSFSSLVEELLRQYTATEQGSANGEAGRRTFSQRWSGKGRLADRQDPRALHLRNKYGL